MTTASDPILLKNVRLSFPHLFKARAANENAEAKYSAVLLINPKENQDALKEIKKAIITVAEEEWGEDWQDKNLKLPVRDGNEKKQYDGYPGMKFITAKSNQRPVCLRQDKSAVVEDDNLFYPGCRVNASVHAFSWSHPTGGKGVSFSLRGVQFVRDDENLGGGRVDVDTEFEDISEDALDFEPDSDSADDVLGL